jgi:uncharacterized lipoprotein YmbA
MGLDRTHTALGAVLVASVMLAACSLNPKEDPTRYYVLSSIAEDPSLYADAGLSGSTLEEAIESAGPQLDISFGVGPITLPSYLKRSRMVTREAGNELRFHETERWGEPMPEGVQNTLTENLGLLATGRLLLHPWYSTQAPDYSVALDVVRFERDSTGTVTFSGRWEIFDREGQPVASSPFMDERPPAGDSFAGSVSAQSAQLAALSLQIADALRQAGS